MIVRIVERFCNSVSDAMFWILIIMAIGVVGVWAFRKIFLTELPMKKKDEEE